MKQNLYIVRITNYPLCQNIEIEKSFYTDDIDRTISQHLRNKSLFKWEVVDVVEVDSFDEFNKLPF